MKTPDEIKKGLECCIPRWVGNHWKSCSSKCPYITLAASCRGQLIYDAFTLIWQLEEHIRDLTKMMPTWISVEDEQKPKHLEQVLCTYGFDGDTERHVDKLTYFAYGDNGYVTGAHFTDEGMYGMRVTHWMPLPSEPKEDVHE